ncbi:hypothetical protein HS088_TW04G00048 [Tripterygium wilfordii]|uniref:PPM-type phosphatase domain-containing protein n=1 Tax=Tripterygium wilfordii TaxID=458696 RepID=A0A7J7DP94_TRIWF|nr:hypothetical protein HS088_TW04G00048 [Tripterygium wilfordii]
MGYLNSVLSSSSQVYAEDGPVSGGGLRKKYKAYLEEKVDSSLEFLILASDGLWDVVTNEEAVAMIKPIQDPQEAAKRLLQEAYQRGSADNITCVVVRFLANQGGSSLSGSG